MKQISQPGPFTWLAAILATCVALFVFQKILWLVVPLLLALMLYYCVRPLVEWGVVRGLAHDTAVKLVMVVLFLLILAVVIVTVTQIGAHAGDLQSASLRYFEGGQNLLRRTFASLERVIPTLRRTKLTSQLDRPIGEFAGEFASKYVGPITLGLLEWLPSLLLVPYLMYFLLKDGHRLKKYIIRSIPNAFFEKTLLLFERLDESLQSYFQGLLRLTMLDTICLAAGLVTLGVSHPLLLGLLCAVLAWVPYVGSMVGCVLVVLVAATDYPDRVWIAYGCLALFLAVRFLDDFVFMPATIGRKLHIQSLLGILMLFLGATVAGATGLMLALPVLGTIVVVGEVVAQVVSDRKLRARYRHAQALAVAASSSGLHGSA